MTDTKKDICFWNNRRNHLRTLAVTSKAEGISMAWYDMDEDVVHEFICDDHRCNANHEGHRWEFEDERNSWVITLKHKQPECLWKSKTMVSEMIWRDFMIVV